MSLRNTVRSCTHFIYHLLTCNCVQSRIRIPAGVEPWDGTPLFRGVSLPLRKQGSLVGAATRNGVKTGANSCKRMQSLQICNFVMYRKERGYSFVVFRSSVLARAYAPPTVFEHQVSRSLF